MTNEPTQPTLPNAGEKILLLNPPIYDTRFHWSQWMQPLTLLQLSTYARNAGADVKLIDALEVSRAATIRRTRIAELELDEYTVYKWRFGETQASLLRQFRDLRKMLWEPDRIYIDCFTTFWWEGAAELAALAHDVFPRAKMLLTGAYGALAQEHASQHLPLDAIATIVSTEVSTLPSDFRVYTSPPRFAYISTGNGRRTAEDVYAEICEKLTELKVQHFAFVEHGIADHHVELFEKVLDLLPQLPKKAAFYALGNIEPGHIVKHPSLPAKMKKAGFAQVVFADDRHLPLSADSEDGLIQAYRHAAELCIKAGFPERTDSLVGSICIGRRGEDLEARARLATTIAHYAGSIILWAYQPQSAECHGVLLENQNGKIFPLRGHNIRTYGDYLDLLGLAAILNAKYRERTFDFLGEGLVPRLLRDSFGRRGWEPDPAVKGSLVLPVRPSNARRQDDNTIADS